MRETRANGENNYIPGNNWYVCDECGFNYRRSEIKKRYDNAVVCSQCWEPQHPQEKKHVLPKERINVPNARPPQEDRYLSPGEVTQDDL